MSKPVFQDLFKFSGRRNRLSYNLFCLAAIAAFIIDGTVAFAGIRLVDDNFAAGLLLIIPAVAAFFVIAVSSWAVASQRMRDMGHSGFWVVLSLLPYIGWMVSLALMIIPSNDDNNKYGPSCIE
jgi:uncharacterized membrane protein YhaH (DUF805 family)